MHECRHCGRGVEDRFRFCPWCAAPQRTKIVEFFAPHPAVTADAGKGLRVSRYFGDEDNPRQLRFSIWSADSAVGAISLSEEEAARLAQFLAPPRVSRKPILDQIRESLRL
ncbi:MAG: hypothetical protein H0V68_11515 [Actinobacteria bacterium]|nr:hypothetical protein [Actinomycetota bacterium]